jgi:hypothetical protein
VTVATTGETRVRGRRWWQLAGSVATVALLAWGVLQVVALLARTEQEVRAGEDAAGLEEVVLDAQRSSVSVRGTDGAQVLLDGRLVSDVREARLHTHRDGARWLVEVRCDQRFLPSACGADLELAVPDGIAVRLQTSNAPIRLVGLTAPVDATTSNAPIRGADLGGPLRLRTSNHSVELRGLRSTRVDVQSSNGGLLAEFAAAPDAVSLRTSNDDVDVVVPDRSGPYALDLSTSNGSAAGSVRSDPSARRRVEVRTSNADVTVRYPR